MSPAAVTISRGAITLITYLWHYLIARLVYDQLLRPLIHGHTSRLLLVCGSALVAFAIGSWRGRRRGRVPPADPTWPDRRRRG